MEGKDPRELKIVTRAIEDSEKAAAKMTEALRGMAPALSQAIEAQAKFDAIRESLKPREMVVPVSPHIIREQNEESRHKENLAIQKEIAGNQKRILDSQTPTWVNYTILVLTIITTIIAVLPYVKNTFGL